MVNINIYLLGLLKFNDDTILLSKEELETIQKHLRKAMNERGYLIEDDNPRRGNTNKIWAIYKLKNDLFQMPLVNSPAIEITSAYFGYYHHRVITYIQYVTRGSNIGLLSIREIREEIKKKADKILKTCISEINSIKNLRIRVKEIYTYFLIVIEGGDSELKGCGMFPYSLDTSTLYFDFIEPSWFKSHGVLFGKKYSIRISIPGTILYSSGKASRRIVRDLINSIYHCLYIVKDTKKGQFDESILIDLWEHLINITGGKTVDINIIRIALLSLVISLIAIFMSLLSLYAT